MYSNSLLHLSNNKSIPQCVAEATLLTSQLAKEFNFEIEIPCIR